MVSQSSSPASSGSMSPLPYPVHDGDYHMIQPDPSRILYDVGDLAPAPFENKTRYVVVWMEVFPRYPEPPTLVYWVCMNALAPTMPSKPTLTGPLNCSCSRPGDDLPLLCRYGQAQHAAEIWQPDWVKERVDPLYSTAYIPALFSGEGPCAKRDVKGPLTQWDPSWVTRNGSKFELTAHASQIFSEILALDQEVEARLGMALAVASPVLPAAASSVLELREGWARLAADVAKRRGALSAVLIGARRWAWFASQNPALHARLLASGYYALGTLGVWVEDTAARLVDINEFLKLGVPVFFKWDKALLTNPAAQKLVPPQRLFPSFPQTPPRRPLPLPLPAPSAATTVSSPRQREPPTPEDKEPKRTKGAEPGEVADDESDIDYTDAAFDEVFTPGRTRNSARVRLPVDAEPLEATAWVRVPFGTLYSSAPPPGQTVRVRSGLELMTVRALTHTPPPDATSAARSLAERLDNDVPPPAPRRRPDVIRRPPVLRIYDQGSALAVLRSESDHSGFNLNAADIIQIAIAHGMQFHTPVQVVNPNESVTLNQHVVSNAWWPDGAMSSGNLVRAWEANILRLAKRPHVWRAALMLGGLYSRIAKEYLPDGYEFPFGPTRAVVDYGVPIVYRVSHDDGIPLHDDYLSEDERLIFIGAVKCADNVLRTLWPREEILRSEGYRGVWTTSWERWFVRHLQELRSDTMKPKAYSKWKSVMRAVADKDDGSLSL
ncbi:hypothetical protein EXIGLDRAFT_759270 [Exidia glandulosa HHB12029]|uniref:Uncharacterized protein n=1 Tax=Exidia glandulosa HHB12029 TaxID=1314781 RepID=A0A165Q1K8_EXIGL|nr:hypothetical protein EXIGLDRAFT_759270 [Exidia glandulosa HHB12029]